MLKKIGNKITTNLKT